VKLGLVTPLQLMAEVAGLVAEDLIQIGYLKVNGHDVEIPVDPVALPEIKQSLISFLPITQLPFVQPLLFYQIGLRFTLRLFPCYAGIYREMPIYLNLTYFFLAYIIR